MQAFPNFLFNKKIKGQIPQYQIVLDTESSDSIFRVKSLLNNVITIDKKLKLITNTGSIVSKENGYFADMSVWHNNSSIANILGLYYVARTHRVVIDILKEKAMCIKMKSGKWIKFKQEKISLFACDLRKGLVNFNFKSNKLSYQLHSFL